MGANRAKEIIEQVEKVVIGKREAIELAVICLLSKGHLLIEDIPGVGKTTLARTLAQTLGCDFGRIQFTPDTLPSDVTGVSVYRMNDGEFRYMPGGIMHQIVLADEINRATPKTQASLLEAMEERQVSVDGKTYELPKPFMVMATENPLDELGTYQLPEAQLDRFFLKLSLGYPSREEEEQIVEQFLHNAEWKKIKSQVAAKEILRMQEEVEKVFVHPDLISFVLEMAEKTREHRELRLGASPRAVLALIRGAQASAYVENREYVIPDDVIKVLYPVLSHRLLLTAEARMNQKTPEKILAEIRSRVVLPVLIGNDK
jgi:MoxR-like ATPase